MSSSPAPSSSPSVGRHAKSSPHAGLAFLVHSPNTVANDLPPDVDNKPLARQKRRRTRLPVLELLATRRGNVRIRRYHPAHRYVSTYTDHHHYSKEDEDVLKAEYQKNPKPDKAARIDIVSKVALGEREVQIWFQNKRQNDRRRSRPLDPSSTPILMSSSSTMSDPATEDDPIVREIEQITEARVPEDADQVERPDAPTESARSPEGAVEDTNPVETKSTEEEAVTVEAPEGIVSATAKSQATADSDAIPSTDPQTADTAPTEISGSQQTLPSSQGASQSRTSWISNRRSASFRYNEDYAPETITFPNNTQPSTEVPATKSLKRAHSFVRISTNEDGTARIVTDLDKTPSPPHPRSNPANLSRAAAGLRRSYSAAGLNERLAAVAQEERSPKMPKTSSTVGRSRDSRAWEFWCDPDSRHNTTLTTRAEQEGSGSAADAIGLLRANRKVLAQNQARQNTPIIPRHQSSKMSSENGVKKSRGSMQRASTISGRLQSKDSRKSSDSSDTDELPQTESDKENWEPSQPQQCRPRQSGTAFGSQRVRQVLGENTEIMSQSASLGNMLVKDMGSTPRKGGRKNSDPESDEELRNFMGGGASARSAVSSAEEAGCVEGLLKLSQGQWR